MVLLNKYRNVRFSAETLPFENICERLAAGGCPAVFPAEIIRDGLQIREFCCIEGFHRLRDVRNLPAESLMLLFREIVRSLQLCCDWLLFPEKMILTEDTIYFDRDGRIRILYIPDPEPVSAAKKMTLLLYDLKRMTDAEGEKQLQFLMKKITEESLSFGSLLAAADQMIENMTEGSENPF
ncbi:MAG: hypothetical protein PUK54_09510 [Firmicutes bacterium]|nr:hypothetical protein [Bacillota bacterium]MDY5855756.1 hypothetical protein [Anaerovoracaceae bacterium]